MGNKVLYKDDVKEIVKKFEISKEGKASIRAIQETLALKNMTDAGKDRKKRMWTKLFYEKDKLCLYSNMFLAVLPLFKSLVYVLEQKQSQIHKLYDMMTENMRFFFACFMKFEELDKVQSDKLNSINVSDLVRKKKYLFVGKCNDKLIKKLKTSASGWDSSFPLFNVDDRLDEWWNNVFKTGQYPILSQLVKAALSIFTGPMVEGSFSMMGDVITKRKGRMMVDTYSSYMTTKYHLSSNGKNAVEEFHRPNVLRSPVNGNLGYHVRTAYSRHKKRLNKNKEMVEKKRTLLLSDAQKSKGKVKKVPKKKHVHKLAKDANRLIILKGGKRSSFEPKRLKVNSPRISSTKTKNQQANKHPNKMLHATTSKEDFSLPPKRSKQSSPKRNVLAENAVDFEVETTSQKMSLIEPAPDVRKEDSSSQPKRSKSFSNSKRKKQTTLDALMQKRKEM